MASSELSPLIASDTTQSLREVASLEWVLDTSLLTLSLLLALLVECQLEAALRTWTKYLNLWTGTAFHPLCAIAQIRFARRWQLPVPSRYTTIKVDLKMFTLSLIKSFFESLEFNLKLLILHRWSTVCIVKKRFQVLDPLIWCKQSVLCNACLSLQCWVLINQLCTCKTTVPDVNILPTCFCTNVIALDSSPKMPSSAESYCCYCSLISSSWISNSTTQQNNIRLKSGSILIRQYLFAVVLQITHERFLDTVKLCQLDVYGLECLLESSYPLRDLQRWRRMLAKTKLDMDHGLVLHYLLTLLRLSMVAFRNRTSLTCCFRLAASFVCVLCLKFALGCGYKKRNRKKWLGKPCIQSSTRPNPCY